MLSVELIDFFLFAVNILCTRGPCPSLGYILFHAVVVMRCYTITTTSDGTVCPVVCIVSCRNRPSNATTRRLDVQSCLDGRMVSL